MSHPRGATRREFLSSGVAAGVGSILATTPANAQQPPRQPSSSVTPSQVEGPFYRPGAPYRTKLYPDDPQGDVLVVSGVVRAHPTHQPLAGVLLDIWNASHLGDYDSSPAFRLRGKMRTDAHGRYEFETIVPPAYPVEPGSRQMRAQHVHFKVFADGYVPLTTQMYFDNDPYLDLDFVASDYEQLMVRLHAQTSEKARKARGLERPFYTCTFDIVLPPLSQASYRPNGRPGAG